jgi:hypothetical protein
METRYFRCIYCGRVWEANCYELVPGPACPDDDQPVEEISDRVD